MRSSNGRASPVWTVKQARAGLIMVIFWSWMVSARTSFFTVRIPAWNRNGSTLHSNGSGSMLLPVLRTGVACCLSTCAQGSSVLSRSLLGMALPGSSGCSWEVLVSREVLALLVYPLVCVPPGLRRRAYHWTRPLGGGRWGTVCVALWEFTR